MSKPSLEEFYKATQSAAVVALSVTIHYDTETAISLADRFVNEEYFFLLESATAGPGGIAKYSFMGFEPLWSFQVKGDKVECGWQGSLNEEALASRNPLSVLEHHWHGMRVAVVPTSQQLIDGIDLCRMGGVVGYVSYDVAHHLEPAVGQCPPPRLKMPGMIKYLPKNFFVLDQLSRKLTMIRYVRTDLVSSLEDASTTLEREWDELQTIHHRVARPHIPPALRTEPGGPDYEACHATFPRTEFLPAVENCLNEIRNGEIFQIQIGNRLSCPCKARPFDVFRHLRILNPSPYMVFFKFGEEHIICASPEMMVNVSGRKVLHRPIAGTRKRTWQVDKDRQMKHELSTDEKERAEHVMLVDLSRNDLGRIAKPGSVNVDELMVVEEYSHVFHLVSQVSAELRDDVSAFEALSVSFPNGTVSGAPKIRAMQLINEIEPCSRQFYAGSLGIFDFSGDLRSTILIRTIHIAGGVAATQASAGVVYDSVPELEWQETRNKMAACLVAIQRTR